MYREAAEQINKGLSLGARITLGAAALLLAVMVLTIETPVENLLFVYAFAGFNLAITVACVTQGRLRQFTGSLIGVGFSRSLRCTWRPNLGRVKFCRGAVASRLS